jgi:hypothetical protein
MTAGLADSSSWHVAGLPNNSGVNSHTGKWKRTVAMSRVSSRMAHFRQSDRSFFIFTINTK